MEKTIKFTRKQKSIIDVIANICSLALTIYNILNIIFAKIYSTNFDPYKILQKILNNNSINNPKQIELSSIFKEKDSLMPLSNDDINYKSKIINENTSYDESLKSNFIQNKEVENDEDIDDQKIKMPKLATYDYLLNNIYNFKQWKSFKQEVITYCKEILLKYLSIDNLLYNQIRLENLLLDYNWNNPNLKYIKNNEFIGNLKNKIDNLKELNNK